jgi:hypothetical protein
MITITETEVVQACRTLFGEDVNISRDFLSYVQPSGVKSAYRRKAMENHPDFFAAHALTVQQKQTALFRDILRAYDILNLFFKQREEGTPSPAAAARPATGRKREQEQKGPPPKPAPARKGDGTYYHGNVPIRTLQIGQYLYYRGKISFGELINALVWQRKQRPSIGDIALRWGMLDAGGVDRIFKACDRPRLFGEKAVELGLLSVFQVNTILLYQRSRQDRLGNFFCQNNILSREELERLAVELKEHNAAVLAASINAGRTHRAYA